MQPSRKRFLVNAAIVGAVAEAFQCELMKDSRIARNSDLLWASAAKALRWVVDLSARTYALLGSVCGLSGAAVADTCINGAHISLELLHRRVLSHADSLPWILLRGDIEENLRDMASRDKPIEPVSGHLWELMQQDYNIGQLAATVDL